MVPLIAGDELDNQANKQAYKDNLVVKKRGHSENHVGWHCPWIEVTASDSATRHHQGRSVSCRPAAGEEDQLPR
ncbi:hypothetical protein [Marinobacterium rhizophilum]|uniref:Uncharacterized protein n=1 Tax=Marinobacterium rhizophilum TaxID=420402 RepID=A0ABY5HK38_9GAMM|nr:hypothetical protein [Marinobacterium rhizophilum]UTW12314.1 hypothetical protein KDW95_01115 [Marinobacterium rhizophilum]